MPFPEVMAEGALATAYATMLMLELSRQFHYFAGLQCFSRRFFAVIGSRPGNTHADAVGVTKCQPPAMHVIRNDAPTTTPHAE